MKENITNTNEKTWDTIAESFDKTRKKPWKKCIDFTNELPKVHTVADIGCGNGRHLIPWSTHCNRAIGIDISSNLLRIIQNKIKKELINNVTLIQADMVNLPIKTNSIDAVMCIASIHNIKGRNHRIMALKDIFRILKKNGTALISVWSRWQDKYRMHFLKKIFNSKEEFGDMYIYWRQNKLNIPRFYHLYSKREFLNDLTQAKFIIKQVDTVKIHSQISADNFFAEVKKE